MILDKNIKKGTMLWLKYNQGFLHNKLLKVVKGDSGKCFAILDWDTHEEIGEDRYSIENYIGEVYAYVGKSKESNWSIIKEVLKDLASGAAGAVSHTNN